MTKFQQQKHAKPAQLINALNAHKVIVNVKNVILNFSLKPMEANALPAQIIVMFVMGAKPNVMLENAQLDSTYILYQEL